jgi:hypothetical protein
MQKESKRKNTPSPLPDVGAVKSGEGQAPCRPLDLHPTARGEAPSDTVQHKCYTHYRALLSLLGAICVNSVYQSPLVVIVRSVSVSIHFPSRSAAQLNAYLRGSFSSALQTE